MTARTKILWTEVACRAFRHGKRARRLQIQSEKKVAHGPVVACRVTSIMLDCIEETLEWKVRGSQYLNRLSKTGWASSPEKEVKASVDEFKQSSGITACSS